jgi:hypothetical protein
MAVTQYGFHETLVNNHITTLNGAITASATSITLTDATGLPAKGFFRLEIGSEIILCESTSGSVVTATTRGAEGTTAAAHSNAAEVKVVLTNKALWEYWLRNGGNVGGGTVYTGETSFADGHGYPVPLGRSADHNRLNLSASSFTWHNQGSATIADSAGGYVMTIPDEANHKLRGVTIPAPPTPYVVTTRMRVAIAPGQPIGVNSTHAGLWWRENATGKIRSLSLRNGQAMAMWNWTDWNTWSTTIDLTHDYDDVREVWIRIVDDGTDHKGYFSTDGSNWTMEGSSWWQVARTNHFTTAADQIGFYLNSGTNSGSSGAGPATCTVKFDGFNVERL